ncbi:AsmA family protein [Candidatus Pelagibacter sp.]|nr:AsmA family protein [Candidatus Pelagibacter sp.]
MNKHNLLIKKVKQRFLSINNLIESYFNKLKFLKKNFRKIEFIKNNRVFFGISTLVILTFSYFLIPTMYDHNIIQSEIKNQISKKYNIKINFNENIRYGLLPKPHFQTKNLSIIRNKNEIGSVGNFKIYIDVGNFFSFNKIQIKDLILKKTAFNIKKDDIEFFEDLLKTEPNENKIIFKKSDIFFRGSDDELLFLNKIKIGKFYYDSFNLVNVFSSKNEIFKTPYKFDIKNDKFNKNVFFNFNSKKIRLDIENNTSYADSVKEGLISLLFINKDISLDYEIKDNSIIFSSKDRKKLHGFADLKPFYLETNLSYDGISTKDFFNKNSMLIDLIKSEIFNNNNLNININLDVKDITNSNELNNLLLDLNLEQGSITFSDSEIMWKDDLYIKIKEGLVIYSEGEILLIGKLIIDVKNIDNFYKSFQVKKIYRKDIKEFQLDFIYNLDNNKFQFDNILIDNASNSKVDKFINKFNSSNKVFSNKITFKNFINNLFVNYLG